MSKTGKYWLKRIIVAVVITGLVGAGAAWYLIHEEFSDTQSVKADYTVEATVFIKEFEKDAAAANQKYTDKIVTVSGKVAATENPSDTITNIKFTDTTTGSYAIFAFQGQHLQQARQVKEGDQVAIKGSCSGGNYSDILESTAIEFKRCALDKTSDRK